MIMAMIIHVSQDTKGDFQRLTDALQSIPKDYEGQVIIFLHEGIYKEKLYIDRPFITIIGDGAEKTVITYDDYALNKMPDGTKRGTFRTQTMLIYTHDFTAKDITIENNAGFGKKVGQALALYVDGDRNKFFNCRLLGSQDTLFTGPLPPSELKAGGFTGPLEHAPRINGRQYYYQCYIRGDVDFIFGSATAYFEECEIYSQKYDEEPSAIDSSQQKIYGYVTAASTAEGQDYGYVFNRCRLTGNCPVNSVYLGRPWRNYAKTVFIECELGEHIRREGWHDWSKPEAHDTIYYAEYHSLGPGAAIADRAPFSRQLTDEEAEHYTREKVLGY